MRFYNISEEKNSLNSQCAFCAHFAVCSAHSVVCSLLFAVTYTNTVVFVVGIVWCCHARLFRDERAVAKEVTHVDFVGSYHITGGERGKRKR